MESMPKTKAELLEQLRQESAEMDRLLATLSDKQLTELHDKRGWTIQDHLDHLAVWQEGVAAMLEKKPRYEAMGVDIPTMLRTTEDEQNQILRERTHRTLPETRAALAESYQHLLRALKPLTIEDLYRSYSYYQPNEHGEESGRPAIAVVVNNSSKHYEEHIPWIKAIAGRQGNK